VRWASFEAKQAAVAAEQRRLEGIRIPGAGATAAALLKRPEYRYADVAALPEVGGAVTEFAAEQQEQVELQIEVQAKYSGYIERQTREIARHARQESLRLPEDIDYGAVHGLSTEARQRLVAARPATLGQASRLEGMTPSAVSLLLVHLKRRQLRESA
jgi:tRNA uridine 5-carboxymethylaminomethyl modification enzyme